MIKPNKLICCVCGKDAVDSIQGFSSINYHFCETHYTNCKLDMFRINILMNDGNKVETPFLFQDNQHNYNPYMDAKNFVYPKNI